MTLASAARRFEGLSTQRVALGISYRGLAYQGWQSQASGQTVQDKLEKALSCFADQAIHTLCAGRTDAGVHGLNQVVHFDTTVARELVSWIRGTNRYLPSDIAVQWCRFVAPEFHARSSARGRRYIYILRESPVRPALESGLVGWVFRPLELLPMQVAVRHLLGEHDFSSFRAAQCQALSPVKTLHAIEISQRGGYWRFEFDASAYLHHMVRNIMGCLLAIGQGGYQPDWMLEVLRARSRKAAAPTFAAEGLYFSTPYYDEKWNLPLRTVAHEWLP